MNYKRILGFATAFLIIAIILLVVFYLKLIFAPFLIAYILQFALRPLVNILEQRGVKHKQAVAIVFISSFLIIALSLYFFVPAVASELSNIQDNLKIYTSELIKKYDRIQTILLGQAGPLKKILEERSIIDEITNYLETNLMFFLQKIPQRIFSFLPLILYVLVIPFATFFFLLDAQRIMKKIIGYIPNRYFEISLNIIHNLNKQFGLILRGMLTSALIISTLASFGLWLIGLEYPILVGIFAGLANLIPYFGPVAGTIAAFIVAIVTGAPPVFFLYIIFVFLVVNVMDNVLVQPLVLARAANLHPLVVIFLVLTGSKLGGILGMLLAVPTASLLQVVLIILYEELKRPIRTDFSNYVDISDTLLKKIDIQ